jgi:PAS domain-containing protein
MRILDDAMINALIESNPGDFALYLLDGWKLVKLYAAASLPALSGMTPEEYEAVTAEDATAIILDCDRARAADEMGRMLSEGVDADITYRIMHKDFGFVWVHARARVIGEKARRAGGDGFIYRHLAGSRGTDPAPGLYGDDNIRH